jgi:hypothetical protein
VVLQDISFDENDVAKVVYVTYRIRSENLIHEELTSSIGIQPTKSYSRGEKYLGKAFDHSKNKIVRKWRVQLSSLWDLDSKIIQNHSKKVEDHIDYLLNILEPHSDQIMVYLKQRDIYFISFYIRWEPLGGHGTYTIQDTVLERMSKLCHFVEFSFISSD